MHAQQVRVIGQWSKASENFLSHRSPCMLVSSYSNHFLDQNGHKSPFLTFKFQRDQITSHVYGPSCSTFLTQINTTAIILYVFTILTRKKIYIYLLFFFVSSLFRNRRQCKLTFKRRFGSNYTREKTLFKSGILWYNEQIIHKFRNMEFVMPHRLDKIFSSIREWVSVNVTYYV